MRNVPILTASPPPREQQQDRVYEIGPLSEAPFEIKKRESVRERLAITLTYTVIAAAILPMAAAIIFPDRAPIIKELAPIVIGPLIGIYGTVLGFYFSQNK
jgi:hypothetical protein